ncbi:helix-turn-helix domain-containing protein [bacterium]|nr:helix-turn-helix domain-containing protein [bacterium]
MKDDIDIMIVNEVAQYLRVPVPTIYKLLQEGRLPGFKVGKHWRIRRCDLEQYAAQPSNSQVGSK